MRLKDSARLMYGSWIKLYRKLLGSEVFGNEKLLKVWIWCLLKAQHQATKMVVGYQPITLNPGEFIFGRIRASEELGMKQSTVRNLIATLVKMGNLDIKTTNKFSLVKIKGWCLYQNEGQQLDNNLTTKGQQLDTLNYKNEKNEKNDKKIRMSEVSDAFNQFWNAYPKKELKKKSWDIWKLKKLDTVLPEILSFVERARTTDRWKKGFIKQPPVFLRNEVWNDDLTAYWDSQPMPGKRDEETRLTPEQIKEYEEINNRMKTVIKSV